MKYKLAIFTLLLGIGWSVAAYIYFKKDSCCEFERKCRHQALNSAMFCILGTIMTFMLPESDLYRMFLYAATYPAIFYTTGMVLLSFYPKES